MLVLVGEELEEDIDVMPNDGEILVGAKAQKLWARVCALSSSFGNRGAMQSESPVANSARYEVRWFENSENGILGCAWGRNSLHRHTGAARIRY